MFITVKYRRGKCLLRDRLREAGINQAQLADRADMKESHVSGYVHGTKRMNLDTAKTFSVILNCRMDDLYDWIVEE
ncbi:helix-turn-helix transcriptional regulator [Bacillus swezeyi]|uniref:helix-turn-helix domain-containing protein n=1 Tax=Bacillus swezeyi TaxID=1925020 RepID=UPI002E1B97A4|nr:helix-turn-helix transcriptional regulator [Bacillus swezeyi]